MPYGQIIPDYRYDEDEALSKKKRGGKQEDGKPVHVCVPYPMTVSIQKGVPPTEKPPEKTEPKSKPSSPKESQPATKDAETSPPTKAACMPLGGAAGGGNPPPVKMMLCLPCPPPSDVEASQQTQQSRKKPRDYTYRCESRELRGGNLYHCCQCNKRNGLQHDCPRTPCQGRPACLTKPWPDCWPSGGCHGIDYSRENGVKRYDPCCENRFDNKDCKPPGHAPKPDCGGNMMVVVCPPPQ